LKILDFLHKGYAAIFHLVVNGAFVAIGLFLSANDFKNVQMAFVPAEEGKIPEFLLVTGLIGLLTLALAVTGKFRYAFPVYCLIFAVQAFRQIIFPGSAPLPENEVGGAMLAMVIGGAGAFLSSLVYLKAPKKKS
jgi:hypothetical protein